ncbi:hypothetical protein SL057_002429 [Flavobacterium psychrophilum]|nr:hypothetical protein [Flavobacterium psychrophilum]
MKTLTKTVLIIIIGICLLAYFSLYFITPGFLVKSELESFLENELDQKVVITKIENEYSPDLFHQVTGYKIEMEDSSGFKYDNIYIQKNQVTRKWDTYRTLNIKQEYSEAKAKTNKK